MKKNDLVKNIILNNLSFKNGKWFGLFDFIFVHNDKFHNGSATFHFDKTWHILNFQYGTNLNETIREKIREDFNEKFEDVKKTYQEFIFVKREELAIRPQIDYFEINEHFSDKNLILINFSLVGIKDNFYINIQLINETWEYKISSRNNSTNHYKNFYKWEDAVFDEIIKEINKIPKYRLRFVVHDKKYKYK